MTDSENTKASETDGESDECEEQWSDDDFETREIILGLPALSISGRVSGDINVSEREEKEGRLNEQAVAAAELVVAAAEKAVMKGKSDAGGSEAPLIEQAVAAAELVVAAAEEAVMKGKSDEGGSGGKKKGRPRTSTKTDDEADGLSKGEAKKPKKKGSELTNPPKGPPVCHICGRGFGSWKAVFGHMRAHKDRNYQGFLPPPTFSAAAEVFSIPGKNSAFALLTAGGGSSAGITSGGGSSGSVACGVGSSVGIASSGGSSGGFPVGGAGGAPGVEVGRDVGIDLNVKAAEEEEEEEATGSGSAAKFDLNKSPPKDEEEEGKSK